MKRWYGGSSSQFYQTNQTKTDEKVAKMVIFGTLVWGFGKKASRLWGTRIEQKNFFFLGSDPFWIFFLFFFFLSVFLYIFFSNADTRKLRKQNESVFTRETMETQKEKINKADSDFTKRKETTQPTFGFNNKNKWNSIPTQISP